MFSDVVNMAVEQRFEIMSLGFTYVNIMGPAVAARLFYNILQDGRKPHRVVCKKQSLIIPFVWTPRMA